MTTIAETSPTRNALDWTPAAGVRGSWLDKLLLAVFLLYLATNVFDGVLRYALVNLNLPTWLLYLRDVAVIAVVPLAAVAGLRRSGLLLLFVALATIVHAAIAWSTMHSAVQLLFGIKMLLSVAFGALAARPFEQAEQPLRNWLALLWACAVVGVLLNAVMDFPWTGMVYSVGDVDVEASRDWSSDGVGRAAGLSRSSISAGAQIAILAILLLTTTRVRTIGGFLGKGALFAASLAAVYVTDSRGGLAALAIVGLVLFCRRRGSLALLKPVIFLAVLPVVLLPIFLPSLDLGSAFTGEGLKSFLERIQQGWPSAWDLVFRHGYGLLGRGIGGIGSPQRLFAPQLYNPGDNLTLFLFAYFGIFAALYLAWPLAWTARLPREARPLQVFACALFLYFLLFGVVMNIIEDQFAATFLGLTLALLARGAAAATEPSGTELPTSRMRGYASDQP